MRGAAFSETYVSLSKPEAIRSKFSTLIDPLLEVVYPGAIVNSGHADVDSGYLHLEPNEHVFTLLSEMFIRKEGEKRIERF